MKKRPHFMEMYSQLIALPTISSVEAEYDQTNKTLIDLLATWLADLGFNINIMPVEGSRKNSIY